MLTIKIEDFVSGWQSCPFSGLSKTPWEITCQARDLIAAQIQRLSADYIVEDGIAIHRTAIVEPNATLKGPVIIGENCFVANGCYLRGGVFLANDCIIGPSSEMKTVFMFEGSKIAHLSFVGDSIIGCRVNIEAGAMVANYRNEMTSKRIKFIWRGNLIDTGQDKFGALIADDVRLGANSVVAPGAILETGFKLKRLGLVDLHPDA